MSDYILELKGITKIFPGVKALNNVQFQLKKGEVHALMGENGAGKSTFIKVITGVHKAEEGEMFLEGKKVDFKGPKDAQAAGIAAVYQHPTSYPHLTVAENIFMGHEKKKGFFLDDKAHSEGAKKILQRLEHEIPPETMVGDLRVGQQQMVEIAKALSMNAKILIMDEPTAGLDPQMALELMELAEELHDAGTTVVISTHDVDLAYAWADEIHVLRRGSLVFSGTSEDFYSDPVNVYTTGLMQPSMYQLNDAMSKMKGVSPMPYPRTETQLISKMAPGRKTGRLILIPVKERMDRYMVDAALEKVDSGLTIGLYGSVPRSLLSESQLPVDYVFDGFEACVSDCMAGRDSLLMCSETSMETVKGKIRRLEEFGTPLDWTVIENPHADSTS